MPKITIKNLSKAPQGVTGEDGNEYIAPGHEKTVTVSAADYAGLQAAERADLLKITVVDNDAEPGKVQLNSLGDRVSDADVARLSDDGARAAEPDPAKSAQVVSLVVEGGGGGGSDTLTGGQGADTQGGQEGEGADSLPGETAEPPPPAPKSVEDMDEAELRAFITEKDGKEPHANCTIATLRTKARVLAEG